MITIGSTILPNMFVNISKIITVFLYPFMLLPLKLYDHNNILPDKGGKLIMTLLLSLIIFSTAINSILYHYPIAFKDPIEVAEDPRVMYYDEYFIYTFINNFYSGESIFYKRYSSHFSGFFLDDKILIESSHSNDTHLFMSPKLKSIITELNRIYDYINVNYSSRIYDGKYYCIINLR
jgi:hypothetical protein